MTQYEFTPRKLASWQRGLDLLVELHAMTAEMSERDFQLIGRALWHQGMLMVSELSMMCEAAQTQDKLHHLFCARQALSRFHTRIHLGRQLRIFDVDAEFLRQLERQRLAFERLHAHFSKSQT